MALFVLRKLFLQRRMRSYSVGARCRIFGWTLRLLPYFMRANSDCADAQLAWAFAGRLCDKYHNLMSWLKFHLTIYCMSISLKAHANTPANRSFSSLRATILCTLRISLMHETQLHVHYEAIRCYKIKKGNWILPGWFLGLFHLVALNRRG